MRRRRRRRRRRRKKKKVDEYNLITHFPPVQTFDTRKMRQKRGLGKYTVINSEHRLLEFFSWKERSIHQIKYNYGTLLLTLWQY